MGKLQSRWAADPVFVCLLTEPHVWKVENAWLTHSRGSNKKICKICKYSCMLIFCCNSLHPSLTRSIPGSWIGLPNSQTFLTGMFFGNCPQKFCTFTGHLWKVAKAQKFAPPSSEARESARVGLALVADQTSAYRFACTLSSCNPQCFKYCIHKSFKYIILSNYAAFIAIHDTCKNQT